MHLFNHAVSDYSARAYLEGCMLWPPIGTTQFLTVGKKELDVSDPTVTVIELNNACGTSLEH